MSLVRQNETAPQPEEKDDYNDDGDGTAPQPEEKDDYDSDGDVIKGGIKLPYYLLCTFFDVQRRAQELEARVKYINATGTFYIQGGTVLIDNINKMGEKIFDIYDRIRNGEYYAEYDEGDESEDDEGDENDEASEDDPTPQLKKYLGVMGEYEKKVDLDTCFCLPGDGELSAFIDVARAVARRAERSVVHISKKGRLENSHILLYLNCVSDVLFVMARKKGKKGKR